MSNLRDQYDDTMWIILDLLGIDGTDIDGEIEWRVIKEGDVEEAIRYIRSLETIRQAMANED